MEVLVGVILWGLYATIAVANNDFADRLGSVFAGALAGVLLLGWVRRRVMK